MDRVAGAVTRIPVDPSQSRSTGVQTLNAARAAINAVGETEAQGDALAERQSI